MKKFILLAVFACLSLAFISIEQDKWVVPPSASKAENPTDADKESISIGKGLYVKHCKSCHGKEGEGDGTKSEELETFPGDFTEEEFQAQTDGDLFYKNGEFQV